MGIKKMFFGFVLGLVVLPNIVFTSANTAANNLLVNGDFNQKVRFQDWRILNSLRGWQTNQIQIGRGEIYNKRWGNTTVLQLDASKNTAISQKITLAPGLYEFLLDYAARSGNVKSSAMSVHWNGKQVFSITASNQNINILRLQLYTDGGQNNLQIRGEGQSDSEGMTIARARLFYLGFNWRVSSSNLLINSKFNQFSRNLPISYIYELPGWRISSINQGTGNLFNQIWGNKVVVELYGKQSFLKQSIQLTQGLYRIQVDYSRSENNQESGQTISLLLNGNLLKRANVDTKQIRTISSNFSISRQGEYTLQIAGNGRNDSSSIIIGYIQLVRIVMVKEENKGSQCFTQI